MLQAGNKLNIRNIRKGSINIISKFMALQISLGSFRGEVGSSKGKTNIGLVANRCRIEGRSMPNAKEEKFTDDDEGAIMGVGVISVRLSNSNGCSNSKRRSSMEGEVAKDNSSSSEIVEREEDTGEDFFK